MARGMQHRDGYGAAVQPWLPRLPLLLLSWLSPRSLLPGATMLVGHPRTRPHHQPQAPPSRRSFRWTRTPALIEWEAGTAELVAFDGSRRPVRLGSESPAPADSSVVTATIDHIWQSVWIDVTSATAHPVPRPAEAAGASDDSVWRDANGLVWFGHFEDHNTIATSKDGGATWTSHSFASGFFVPAYSGAKDVLAVLEYEDVNRQRLRLLWVWYSIDGSATWARTEEGSGPADPIENRGGVVRADGRLVMSGPDNAGLLVMDGDWTYFEPAAWTPGGGRFELINTNGWGKSLTVIGRPADSTSAYVSTTPGDDWMPLTVR